MIESAQEHKHRPSQIRTDERVLRWARAWNLLTPIRRAASVPGRTGVIAVLAVVLAGHPRLAVAQAPDVSPGANALKETIVIQPAGRVAFSDMARREALAPPAPQKPSVVRRMPPPQGRAISVPDRPAVVPTPSVRAAESSPIQGGAPAEPLSPALAATFAGLGDNNTSIPPDTMGACGPSHLMVMVNTQVRIMTKTGTPISTVSISTFWTGATGLTGSPFDPKLLFDPGSGRWIASCGANSDSATSKVFFAISATDDPTGVWTFYSFTAHPTGTNWADYPGFGFNQTWIAITNNMFAVAGGAFAGAKMWVIDKSTALAGGPLTLTIFSEGFDTSGGSNGFTLKPCQTFGTSSKLYIVDWGGLSSGGTQLLRMSEISGTAASPSWAVTAGSPFPSAGLFFVANNFDPSQISASQSGTASLVDTGDPRVLNSVYRNGKIWCTQSAGLPVGAVDRTAMLWYQLDPALMASAGAPIVQSGVLDGGAGVHLFFPSIAVNAQNDACIGFSRSDSTRFVEGVFTARSAADAAGTMAPITLVKAGMASYVKDFGGGSIRWGDYSATVVDPADDSTFFTLQEYAELDVGPAADDDRWGTWWARVGSAVPTAVVGPVAPNPRNTAVSSVPVTFSESVTGVDLADFNLTRDGSPVTLTSATVTGAGTSWTVGGLAGLTATNGTYVLTLTALGSGIQDAGGNPMAANASDTWVMDVTPPTATMAAVAPDPRSTAVPSVAVTFSESVTGVDIADFSLTRDAAPVTLAGASVTGSGISWTVTGLAASTGTNGTYVLTLTALGSGIQDTVTNALAANASVTWVMDTVPPTATMASTTTDPTGVSPIPVTVTLSEVSTDFAAGDITPTNATVSGFAGSGTSYSFGLTPSGPGTVTAAIGAGVFTDAAGNGNLAATPFSRTQEQLGVLVSPSFWNIGARALGAVVESGAFVTSNTGNVPEDFAIAGSDGAGGWLLQAATGQNAFRVDVDKNNDGIFDFVLAKTDSALGANLPVGGAQTFRLKYTAPASDTLGAGVAQDFVVTIKASRNVP